MVYSGKARTASSQVLARVCLTRVSFRRPSFFSLCNFWAAASNERFNEATLLRNLILIAGSQLCSSRKNWRCTIFYFKFEWHFALNSLSHFHHYRQSVNHALKCHSVMLHCLQPVGTYTSLASDCLVTARASWEMRNIVRQKGASQLFPLHWINNVSTEIVYPQSHE